jgi:serine/threonine protein kinase
MIGRIVSHYRILEKMGREGIGVIYKAEDMEHKRVVALKFLPPDLTRDAKTRSQFLGEATAIAEMDHPNVCKIFEIDETPDGRLFVAMACFEGETLQERIALGALSPLEAADTAIAIARGLERAHAEGIVHRDVRPANVFITRDGVVKVVDFSLACWPGETDFAGAAVVPGTMPYLSPEQVRGAGLDRRTDVWGLGAVLYEMLTGRAPFGGEYEQAVKQAILNDAPEPAERVRESVPGVLARIAAKALAKDPGDRYQSASEMLAELEAARRELDRN